MSKKCKARLLVLVLAGVSLIPGGAFAGPLFHSSAEPDIAAPAPYYSPCHYWTPLLYRCYAKCYYGVCGHQYTLDYYPTVPSSEPVRPTAPAATEKSTESGEAKAPASK
jgi:hypothetical protein